MFLAFILYRPMLFMAASISSTGASAIASRDGNFFHRDGRVSSTCLSTESGLFIFYSTNSFEGDRIGTYIAVDRLIDPYHAEGKPVTVIKPTLDEDIYMQAPFPA